MKRIVPVEVSRIRYMNGRLNVMGIGLADIAGRCSRMMYCGGGRSNYTILINCDIHSM